MAGDGGALIPEQRRERLLGLLEREIVLSVRQLTDLLGVSHMTVRRDIATLEAEGRAVSVAGGVRAAGRVRAEPSYAVKAVTDVGLKAAIARQAAAHLRPGATLFLDAGTTVGALVPHLLEVGDLTVVTNDFTTLARLMDTEIALVHVGGRVESRNRSSVGRLAAATLGSLNVDVAFLSASSWDGARGVTTPSESKIELKQTALRVTSAAVLLADTTKYGTFSVHRVAALEDFDEVITDDGLDDSIRQDLAERGVRLTTAAAEPAESVPSGRSAQPVEAAQGVP
ncbi:DeoR/GlpR family DNA-binding transcription regulator [Ruania suaedae]|uniref:DeoR/GlpR family DNA-binding transcription regulator n=1 Tax=Ruania suaedae TaxID=2897774 RepID=UPI001E60E3DE|nr:DeoR/GlpR family DNA-binding transcription regulator [Ruania suaedae]UFU02879.1 DeoR/GlpR family DNA-binding transcription regulator [Ruania suaedae]